jgi:hypothetical protein
MNWNMEASSQHAVQDKFLLQNCGFYRYYIWPQPGAQAVTQKNQSMLKVLNFDDD